MEQWEADLRAKLDKELEDGLYAFPNGGATGKQGWINFEVALQTELRKRIKEGEKKGEGIMEQIKTYGVHESYSNLTAAKLKSVIEDIISKCNPDNTYPL